MTFWYDDGGCMPMPARMLDCKRFSPRSSSWPMPLGNRRGVLAFVFFTPSSEGGKGENSWCGLVVGWWYSWKNWLLTDLPRPVELKKKELPNKKVQQKCSFRFVNPLSNKRNLHFFSKKPQLPGSFKLKHQAPFIMLVAWRIVLYWFCRRGWSF